MIRTWQLAVLSIYLSVSICFGQEKLNSSETGELNATELLISPAVQIGGEHLLQFSRIAIGESDATVWRKVLEVDQVVKFRTEMNGRRPSQDDPVTVEVPYIQSSSRISETAVSLKIQNLSFFDLQGSKIELKKARETIETNPYVIVIGSEAAICPTMSRYFRSDSMFVVVKPANKQETGADAAIENDR